VSGIDALGEFDATELFPLPFYDLYDLRRDRSLLELTVQGAIEHRGHDQPE